MDKEFLLELSETVVPCRSLQKEFFADPNDEDELDDQSVAINACFDCPLMLPCGEQALKHHKLFPHGVLGGWTPEDRKRILKERNGKVRR